MLNHAERRRVTLAAGVAGRGFGVTTDFSLSLSFLSPVKLSVLVRSSIKYTLRSENIPAWIEQIFNVL